MSFQRDADFADKNGLGLGDLREAAPSASRAPPLKTVIRVIRVP